jgi:hypothetical protein
VNAANRADVRPFETFDSVESLGTLRGRLEGCLLERDTLRAQVSELLDQREALVRMLQQAMDDGAAWRRRWEEGQAHAP